MENTPLSPFALLFAGAFMAGAAGNEAPALQRNLAGWSVSVLEENDLFVNTDQHYTQGIRVNLLWPEVAAHDSGTLDWLPDLGFETTSQRFGLAIGQNIYTPTDTANPALILTDRPYAGWLYASLIWQRRGDRPQSNTAHLESLEIDLGVVGPWSLAEEAQTWVHKLREYPIPQGWDNQLENEPGLRIKMSRALRWRHGLGGGFEADVMPSGGFSLGNVETYARLGGQLRLGFNLPDNFGNQTIDSLTTTAGGGDAGWEHCWGFYLFAGADGRAVAHNIFLDGNTFQSSHSVDKEPLVGDVRLGGAAVFRWFEVGYTHTFRTREFAGQPEPARFGSLYLQMKF